VCRNEGEGLLLVRVFSGVFCSHTKREWKNLPVNSLSKSFLLSSLHTIYARRQGEPNTKKNLKITQAEALDYCNIIILASRHDRTTETKMCNKNVLTS